MVINGRKLNRFVEKVVNDIKEDETRIIVPEGWQDKVIVVHDCSRTSQYITIWDYSIEFRRNEREHAMEIIAEIMCRPKLAGNGHNIEELHVHNIELVNAVVDSYLGR